MFKLKLVLYITRLFCINHDLIVFKTYLIFLTIVLANLVITKCTFGRIRRKLESSQIVQVPQIRDWKISIIVIGVKKNF